MSSPKISIIVPVYNAEKTIKKCLASVFSQTFQDFEVILVNDGSTDGTMEVVKKLKQCHSRESGNPEANTPSSQPSPTRGEGGRFSIINQENRGASAARNRGAKEARGGYLIFWDADVIAAPTMLEKMFQALENNPQAVFVYSSFKYGFKKFRLWPYDADKLKKMPYIHTTSLIRRECFFGFDQNLKRLQDWDLFLTIAERGGQGIFLPEFLFKVIAGGKISSWLPKWAYKFSRLKKVEEYWAAIKIVKIKHRLA